MAEELGCYLFCAIQTEGNQTFGSAALVGEERKVYTVHYKNYAMVVADAPIQVYEPSRKNAKAHQETIAKVMEEFTVVPMSFGTVLKTNEDVYLLLEQLEEQLKEIFPKVNNKIEVGLKVIGKKEWLYQEANQQSDIKKLKEKTKSKQESYYDQIQIGERAEYFVRGLHEKIENEIFSPLEEIAEASVSNEVISERMLLNASFLIDLEKEEKFDELVNELYEKWRDKTEFKYTGPWPAYNFIDIKLKAKSAT
ncbi:GvpL/GvpF family gas vesicle protein [Alteribacillus bidgolensis]|uniref:Gas vesicle synthesis protein GvpL/GvpF n=1 Tax=Alteribacillus bidgolensis TaxID=930129 RepID=A0A1G8IJ61_9BACI|nr:GvpL/GvpF family gas vesicle protein [Alteribacillus bidgolensis]SDI18976.1 Gas vesicle synthesis protein GvpL/GvpF [Alteribacillus bidgolensis]